LVNVESIEEFVGEHSPIGTLPRCDVHDCDIVCVSARSPSYLKRARCLH
jgi:hypothetical protein